MNTKLPVSILVTYNNMELEGIDTFIGGLKTNYSVVKAKPKWLPKACEGGEVWLDIIADINLIDVLKNPAVPHLPQGDVEHLNSKPF